MWSDDAVKSGMQLASRGSATVLYIALPGGNAALVLLYDSSNKTMRRKDYLGLSD